MSQNEDTPQFREGQLIGGHFRINSFLARGSVSEVYVAQPLGGGEVVVVKILTGRGALEMGGRDRQVGFFLREAAVTAQLSHPNIVDLVEVGIDPEAGHYMALEYLPGKDLEAVMTAEGIFDDARARDVAIQILNALIVADRQCVVHRDLKPSNIHIVTSPGEVDHVKVFDFGVAKFSHSGHRTLSKTDTLVGTPMWMSPEQCRGGVVDHRTDLYAAGAILYFLTTGRPPFKPGTLFNILNQVLSERPKPVQNVRRELGLPPLSRTLAKAIMRALEKSPGSRFADAEHLRSLLDRDSPRSGVPIVSTQPLRRGHLPPGIICVRAEVRGHVSLERLVSRVLSDMSSIQTQVTAFSDHEVMVFVRPSVSRDTTIVQTTELALQLSWALHERLDVMGQTVPQSCLATVGDPTLGLGLSERSSPLMRHLFGLLKDGDKVLHGVLVPPEWVDEVRRRFRVVRPTADPHELLEVLAVRPDSAVSPDLPHAEALVAEALGGHSAPMPVSELERAFQLTVEPIEIFSAISNLQSSGAVSLSADGNEAVGISSELLPTVLPPSEVRMMHLRLFSVVAQQRLNGQADRPRWIRFLEGAHRLSAVRSWLALSRDLDRKTATKCVGRALRLAATRTPNEAVKPILQMLS